MKAVLLSIRPKWCEKILNGEKTVEIRKTAPKLKPPFKVYIYCTKAVHRVSCSGCLGYYEDDLAILDESWRPAKYGNPYGSLGKGEKLLNGFVIAEFICDELHAYTSDDRIHTREEFDAALSGSCMTRNQALCYLSPKLESVWAVGNFYGWHISGLKVYDKPKKPSEYLKEDFDEIYSRWNDLFAIGVPRGCSVSYPDEPKREDFCLTRPPQSWCYVEELPQEEASAPPEVYHHA